MIDELRQLRDADRDHGDDIQGEINRSAASVSTTSLPIGSGTVESACKNVVAARMKGSGMTWTLEGAQHMLQRVNHEFTL